MLRLRLRLTVKNWFCFSITRGSSNYGITMEANEGLEPDNATEIIGGFGRFLVAVASLLTVATVRKLANVFNYAPAHIEECERDKNPGYAFAMSLRERGIINPTDVSILVDALKDVDLHGIAYEVTRSFKKYCQSVQKETLDSSGKDSTGNLPAPDELIESFRSNLFVSQLPGGMSPNQRAQKASFINSIMATYRDLYNRIQPIPFIRDRLLCVDKVFIDSGIERLIKIGINEVWQKLESYHCLLNDLPPAPMRCILFGEPGYGKSTLALQLVYDWCNRCSESPLKNVDLLIFLRLRELRGVSSIMKAIKQFVLPRDSKLTQYDIMEILYTSKSVVILLDGFDEYAHKNGEDDDDVSNIIKGRMFQNFLVIVTTRPSYNPVEMAASTVQVRLTGFDSEAQDDYIRKTAADSEPTAIAKMKKSIEENSILRDLCQVPLFFAMFSHMRFQKNMPLKFESVTSFFRYMIGSFHEHMKNKLGSKELRKYEQFETNHQDLDKAAFEALTGEKQEIVWMKDKLQQLIGKDLYDQYSAVGILIEEETVIYNDTLGSPTFSLPERKTQTRFYHKLFCEWYAAHYISEYATTAFTFTLNRTLRKIDPFELQYVLRFACGISSYASSRIIEYLQTLEGGDKYAILCILEQTGRVDKILESIRNFCDEGVIISGHDSLLLQRSSFQLLEIAAKHDILIRLVSLHNCFQSVELTTSSITTTSGLTLNARIPIKQLHFNLYNREITAAEVIEILEFLSLCPSLKFLCFRGSVPPRSFKVDSTLSTLKSRNIEVEWGMFTDDPEYNLNLETGRWEGKLNGKEPSAEEFENMRSRFASKLKLMTEEYQKEQIKKNRKTLREKAEKRRKNTSA